MHIVAAWWAGPGRVMFEFTRRIWYVAMINTTYTTVIPIGVTSGE